MPCVRNSYDKNYFASLDFIAIAARLIHRAPQFTISLSFHRDMTGTLYPYVYMAVIVRIRGVIDARHQ